MPSAPVPADPSHLPAHPADASPVVPTAAGASAALGRLLQQETTAAATCQRMIDGGQGPAAQALKPILDEHLRRAAVLQERLHAQDAPAIAQAATPTPPAQVVDAEGRPDLEHLSALEGDGVAGYHQALAQLDSASRLQVEAHLLPAQERAVAAVASASSAAQSDQSAGPQA